MEFWELPSSHTHIQKLRYHLHSIQYNILYLHLNSQTSHPWCNKWSVPKPLICESNSSWQRANGMTLFTSSPVFFPFFWWMVPNYLVCVCLMDEEFIGGVMARRLTSVLASQGAVLAFQTVSELIFHISFCLSGSTDLELPMRWERQPLSLSLSSDTCCCAAQSNTRSIKILIRILTCLWMLFSEYIKCSV